MVVECAWQRLLRSAVALVRGAGREGRVTARAAPRASVLHAAVLAWLFLIGTPAHAQCDPGVACCAGPRPGGTPVCGQAGPAQQAATSPTAPGGNPLDVMSGNKHQREVDLPALPGVLGLELVRHYNSALSHRGGPLGRGWRLSYEATLRVGEHELTVVQADGATLGFARGVIEPDRFGHVDPLRGSVVRAYTGLREPYYLWRWPDGRVLRFDDRGRLESIAAASGEFVSLLHAPDGKLVRVSDPQGRQLNLFYDKRGRVEAVGTPVGRFTYAYDAKSPLTVVRVTPPGQPAVSRLYHHEDERHPELLTGISVEGVGADGKPTSRRLVTWAYDERGRAVSSVKGDGKENVERVSVQRKAVAGGAGEAVLTNSLGHTTTYRWRAIAGEQRLLQSLGPGCATCGETNLRYGYDTLGRLVETTKLGDGGQPVHALRHTLDSLGRVMRTDGVAYRDGKAQPPRLLARYAYPLPPATNPTLIARPSVIAGKEHVLRIVYNEAGQPTRVEEEGFSPVDAQGQPVPAGTPISRATTLTYGRVNGRSVLTAIDGPLPNGAKQTPEDSDITRIAWDGRADHVVGWTTPGGFTSTIRREPATGHVASVESAEGMSSQFAHDSEGRLVRIASHGPGWKRPRIHVFRYDSLGLSTEAGVITDEAGTYRAAARHQYDAAGRLLWRASALGLLADNRYDPEGRVIEAGRYSSSVAQVQRFAYDALGRVTEVSDRNGATLRIGYDGSGQPRSHGVGHPPDLRAHRANTEHAAPVRALRDDFGRIVFTASADSGLRTHRYDEADRLVAGRDAQGNVAAYAYDAAGRIAQQRITDPRAAQTTETRWRYAGRRLVALEHPTQSERYDHDERGLLVSKVVTRRDRDGSARTSATRYGWDDEGALRSIGLPDGSQVRHERNGQGQVVEVRRRRIETPWLQWLLPAQTLVRGLERDLVGLKQYDTGNGVRALVQRSREGALARVVYRTTRPSNPSIAARRIEDILAIATAHAAAATPAASASASASASAATAPTTPASGVPPLPGALGLPADALAFIDHRYLWDTSGNLRHVQATSGSASYAYDARDRLLVAQAAGTVSRYLYDASGRRLLAQEGGAMQDLQAGTRKTTYRSGSHRWLGTDLLQATYDETGQPSRIGQREYVWDATGRLVEVRQEDRTLARYRYSHRGERISKTVGGQGTAYLYENRQLSAEVNAQGRLTRQYVYLADQPIVVIDTPQGREPAAPAPGTFQRIGKDLRTAVRAWFGADDERLTWLHANHLGAVEAATDERGQIVWQASYEPFGAARIGKGDFKLNLRLPGQYEDAETGLFYNGQRYYDPSRGEYLTPDPLGTPDGPNPYAYVRGNPLRYVDPDGLVLFAFDGTGNTDDPIWLAAHNSSPSNVVRFREAYIDGRARYVTGVGTDHAGRDRYGAIISASFTGMGGAVPDRGANYSGPARIERMLLYVAEEANLAPNNEVMQVDIVGFSRGAAQARDFANRLVANTRNGWYRYDSPTDRVDPATLLPIVEHRCQRVNFRFMGLWDTVLSTNRSGTAYNLDVPTQFSHVAQAVALNEYRNAPTGVNNAFGALTENFRYWNNTRIRLPEDNHFGGFPLESIGASSTTPGQVRIERGFIGAHADIGGGYGASENGLSTVALSWMVAQAQIAGVRMNARRTGVIMNNPVIHDQSDALRVGNPLTTPTFRAPGLYWGTNTYRVEDRPVNRGQGGATQRTQAFGPPEPGGNRSLTNAETHGFINYTARNTAGDTRRTDDIPEIRALRNRTGTVDMQAYMSWLRQHGYTFAGEW